MNSNETWSSVSPPSASLLLAEGGGNCNGNSNISGCCDNDVVGNGNETIDISKAFVSKKNKTATPSSDHLRQILIRQDFGGTKRRNNGKKTTKRQEPLSKSLSNRRTATQLEKSGRGSNTTASLKSPMRQLSINSSMSSLSSFGSMSTVGGGNNSFGFDIIRNNNNNGSYAPSSKSSSLSPPPLSTRSRNNFLRYTNMDSMNSFGSISNNNRWRSVPSSKFSLSLSPPPAATAAAASVHLRSPAIPNKNSIPSNNDSSGSIISLNSRNHHQIRRWLATASNEQACDDQPIGAVRRKSSSAYLLPFASA